MIGNDQARPTSGRQGAISAGFVFCKFMLVEHLCDRAIDGWPHLGRAMAAFGQGALCVLFTRAGSSISRKLTNVHYFGRAGSCGEDPHC